MVQSSVSYAPPRRVHFSTGDHVFVHLVDGLHEPGMDSVVKGSVTGEGADQGSYDVHLWQGSPRSRERLNVPLELLSDARPAEEEEAARRRAEDEARARAEAERRRAEAARRQEEAKRRSDERLRLAVRGQAEREAQRRAESQRREAERRAQEERLEAERRAPEEARRRAAVQLARRAEGEERARRDEEGRSREAEAEAARLAREAEEQRAALKARWESIKEARLQAAGAQNASREIQRMVLRSDRLKAMLHAKEKQSLWKQKEATSRAKVHFIVTDLQSKRIEFTWPRSSKLRPALAMACERLGLQPEHARFFYGSRSVDPSASPGSLAMRDGDVLEARGLRVRGDGQA